MNNNNDNLQKFLGRPTDSYALWRFWFITTLKRKGYWDDVQSKKCLSDIRMKYINIIASELGDMPFIVYMDHQQNLFSMIEILDAPFASTTTSSLFGDLSNLFGKRHNGKEEMST